MTGHGTTGSLNGRQLAENNTGVSPPLLSNITVDDDLGFGQPLFKVFFFLLSAKKVGWFGIEAEPTQY